MGRLVNVVLPGGKVVSVPEEEMPSGAGFRVQTYQEGVANESARVQGEQHSGILETGRAALEGFAEGATGGAYGFAMNRLGGAEMEKEYQERTAENQLAHTGGEIASILLPTGAPGLAARAGTRIAEQTGSKLLGRAAEGALIGAGGHVATTNVTGDPLSIEGLAINAGIGGVLNVGLGAASDKITKWGKRVGEIGEETAVIRRDISTVKEGRDVFAKPLDSWEGFRTAAKGSLDTGKKMVRDYERAAKAYDTFVRPDIPGGGAKLASEISKTEKSINTIARYWKEDAAAAGTQPVISEDMKAVLGDFRNRLRRIDQLRAGGRDVEAQAANNNKWVPYDKNVAADPARALEELRVLREDMQRFPSATRRVKWGDLPPKPQPAPVVVEDVAVPKSLFEFASMGAERAQKLSDLVANDAAANEAFMKLAGELSVNPADGVAGIHAKLNKYISAADRLSKMARKEAEEEATGGVLNLMKRGVKKFVKYGSARAADHALGGGWAGSFGRVFAGEGSGVAMNATEDLISGALMNGKLSLKQTVAGIVSRFSKPTARVVKELGPVSAYLQNHLLTGEKDDGDDYGELSVKRINDVLTTSVNASDAAFVSVQALMGHPSDVAYKLHTKVVGDIKHLAEVAPKDPGIVMHALQSFWTPSPDQALEFAHRIEAVVAPLKAIVRTLAGDGHPAAVESLWERWPALMQAAAEEFSFAVHDMKNMGMDVASNYSTLFRTPITGLHDPIVSLTLQGLYLPKPEQPQPEQPGSSSSGKPVGRPAAIQSEVAGSSVSGLISQ